MVKRETNKFAEVFGSKSVIIKIRILLILI